MESKGGYVPPALRHKIDHKPKNLAYKPKIVWTPTGKTKEELIEEYRIKNDGKADDAWN